MTLAERAKLGNAAMQAAAAKRAEIVRSSLADGLNLKRAAHEAGVAYRTARRYARDA